MCLPTAGRAARLLVALYHIPRLLKVTKPICASPGFVLCKKNEDAGFYIGVILTTEARYPKKLSSI